MGLMDLSARSYSVGGVVLDQLAVLLVETVPHVVDLLVDLDAVVVALLASTGHGELDAAGMPRADASHLAQTLVRLAGQLLGVPPRGHALESLSLGDADDLDLHDVRLLLAAAQQLLLGVADEAHH